MQTMRKQTKRAGCFFGLRLDLYAIGNKRKVVIGGGKALDC